MKAYRIRHRATGLYSHGGSWPRWTRTGKTWASAGALKRHLGQVQNPAVYAGADVVEVERVETVTDTTPVRNWGST